MEFRKSCISLLLSLTFIQLPLLANEAEDEDLSLEEIMNLEVVSASKHEEKASEAPATIYVITEQDIKKYGYRTLADVLENTPGIEFGNPYSWIQGGQRGFPGNWIRTKLLIDGRPQNLLWTNEPFISNQFLLGSVKQIEIIQGPASVLFGADAYSGIINIRTKNAVNSDSQNYVHVAKGSYDYNEVHATTIVKKNDFGFTAHISKASQKGPDLTNYVKSTEYSHSGLDERKTLLEDGKHPYRDDNDGYLGTMEMSYKIGDLGKVTGGFIFWKNIDGGGVENLERTYTNFNDVREQTHSFFNYEKEIGDGKISLDYTYSYSDTYIRFNERGLTDTDATTGAVTTKPITLNVFNVMGSSRHLVNLQYDQSLFDKTNYLIVGLAYKELKIGMPSYEAGSYHLFAAPNMDDLKPYLNQDTTSFFVQDQQKILGDSLKLTMGVRYDYHKLYKGVFNIRSGLHYQVIKGYGLKFLFGQAFREPSVFEYKDNPDLKPERVDTMEVTAYGKISDFLLINAVVFNSEASKLIKEERSGSEEKQMNTGKKTYQGGEVTTKFKLDSFDATLWYATSFDPDDKENLNIPDHKLGFQTSYTLFKKYCASLAVKYTSPVKTEMNLPEGVSNKKVDSFLTSNLILRAKNLEVADLGKVEIMAGIYNLLDKKNYWANIRGNDPYKFQQTGRSYIAKLGFNF